MFLSHVWGLFAHPAQEWEDIRKERCSIGKCYCSHVLFLAAIPAISGFIGTTQIGWQIGTAEPVKLTVESALMISIATYVTMLVAVFSIGWMIYWMGKTYGTEQQLPQGIALAAFSATPMFLMGLMALYPIPWLNMIVGMPALAYSIYLLYTGLPIMMQVSKEQGFLFASAVMAVGLVVLVAVMAATVIMWGYGIGPVYTSDLGAFPHLFG
ncbi:Yip1 family protein [Sulfuriflexus sp.]|uniref:Yip1 family protein n=1 Tax=Sulfuriflexus sp. TaxID=2015443 RepID=UPI0028CCFB05|nr:Yip1 family protein [Sulfuriflexus sp.]MDT8403626.1 Yip1 family protein [Sulfuriflexus sp.]